MKRFNTRLLESREGEGSDFSGFAGKVFGNKKESVFHPLEMNNIQGKQIYKVITETIKELFIKKDLEIEALHKRIDDMQKEKITEKVYI